jgi:hypothetical protein
MTDQQGPTEKCPVNGVLPDVVGIPGMYWCVSASQRLTGPIAVTREKACEAWDSMVRGMQERWWIDADGMNRVEKCYGEVKEQLRAELEVQKAEVDRVSQECYKLKEKEFELKAELEAAKERIKKLEAPWSLHIADIRNSALSEVEVLARNLSKTIDVSYPNTYLDFCTKVTDAIRGLKATTTCINCGDTHLESERYGHDLDECPKCLEKENMPVALAESYRCRYEAALEDAAKSISEYISVMGLPFKIAEALVICIERIRAMKEVTPTSVNPDAAKTQQPDAGE